METTESMTIKLSDDNYLHWKAYIEAVLQAKNVWDIVKGDNLCPVAFTEEEAAVERAAEVARRNKSIADWKTSDALARTIIIHSINKDHVSLIINCSSSAEMFSAIINHREQRTTTNEWRIRRKLTDLRFTSSHTVSSYFAELESIVKQMKDLNMSVDDNSLMVKVLDDLPSCFQQLRQSIEIQIELGQEIKLKNLKAHLLVNEKRNENESQKHGEALFSKINKNKFNNNKLCWICGGRNHLSNQCRKRKFKENNNFAKQNSNNQKQQINNNNNYNHNLRNNNNYNNNYNRKHYNQNNNRYKHNQNVNSNQVIRNNSNFVNNVQNETNDSASVGNDNFSLTINERNAESNNWLLDTGASYHLTSNINCLTNYSELPEPILLTIGDGKQIEALARGDVYVECYNGDQWIPCKLTNVLFVPKLGNFNLFSWGQTVTKGFGLRSTSKLTEIYHIKSNKNVIIAKKFGNTFRLMIKLRKTDDCVANVAKIDTLSDWHKRLAHINVYKIIQMSNDGILPKIKIDYEPSQFTCEGCIKGKMIRKSFKSVTPRKVEVGEALHADLQGPMSEPSLNGSKLALVIKDEESSFRSVYFQRFKSESCENLEKFIKYTEKVTGNKVKIVRTDNGKEFIDMRVKTLFENNNITHELSAPYTAEQNGRIERENRTISELTRSMLLDNNLPEFLWAEAMATTVYVLNCIPSKGQRKLSPLEMFTKEKPKFTHLRSFGCVCWTRVPDIHRKKWSPRGKKCIFVGYTNTINNFRVYDPTTGKVFVSANVKFIEEKCDATKTIDQVANEETTDLEKLCEDDKNENNYDYDKNDDDDDARSDTTEIIEKPPNSIDWSNLINNIVLQANLTNCEPTNYSEVINSPDKAHWLRAMKEEMKSIKNNETYILTELPPGKRLIQCRWVFRIKRNLDGTIDRYKARLVAKGFSQKPGIDYFETFSPVARYDTIRAVLSISTAYKMDLIQFDIKTAFLYGELNEEIYMVQPPGFEDGTNRVLRLKKGLYGLKQSPRQWNQKVNDFFKSQNYHQCEADKCAFVNFENGLTICVIYVDDGLIASDNQQQLTKLIDNLKSQFEVKVHRPQVFVGMEIHQSDDKSTIKIKQSTYVKELLKRFGMDQCKPISTPGDTNIKLSSSNEIPDTQFPYQEAIGALLYLSIISRPDITFMVNKLSQFNCCYQENHWKAIKRIFRYLQGTLNIGIIYSSSSSNLNLIGFCDADYAADVDTRKSTSGFLVNLGGSPVSWSSRLQKSVATSTTEAEYIAIADCVKDIIWYKQLMKELKIPIKSTTKIMSDNQGAIKLTKNSVFHKRTKHIDVRYHFIRDHQEKGEIQLHFIPTDKQPADMLTKCLYSPSLRKCCDELNIN